jgi:methyl-accepting chemotaxis protein
MTSERRSLVTGSWKLLTPQSVEVAATFYRRLFEFDPDLRTLFSSTVLDDQIRKLTSMLELAVQWLDVPERLVPALKQLGERHAVYGVQDHHYATFGAALIATLEERLGDDFTPELRSAWTEAYALISALMRRGAMKVSGQFPTISLGRSTTGEAPFAEPGTSSAPVGG